MKYLKKYNEVDLREVMDYIQDVLLELDDESYGTIVSLPSGNPTIKISKKLETGYSVINGSDVLPTLQHIISYMDEIGYSNYKLVVQLLWHDYPSREVTIDELGRNKYSVLIATFSK